MTLTTTSVPTPPTPRALARWYLLLVGVALLGIAAVTLASHVLLAAQGVTLVFSQDDVREGDAVVGPAPTAGSRNPPPMPAGEALGGTQYVDLPGLALTMAGGAIATAGAIALSRRSRMALPLGLAAAGVAAIVGLFPAVIGLWAADIYGMTSPGQLVPYLAVSALLVGVALWCGVSVWRRRGTLASA